MNDNNNNGYLSALYTKSITALTIRYKIQVYTSNCINHWSSQLCQMRPSGLLLAASFTNNLRDKPGQHIIHRSSSIALEATRPQMG